MMERRARLLGGLSLICLITTVGWLVLLIYGTATRGSVGSYQEAVAYAQRFGLLDVLTYLNAVLITLSASMVFAGLGVHLSAEAPLWAAMGAVFVPVYALLNLFAYGSQLTILPRLVDAGSVSDGVAAQMVQAWPGSFVNVLNNLGYAVLGIPSVVYGVLLRRRRGPLRLAGLLLALSGAASIIGIAGVAMGSEPLALGSIVGGVLFLAALIPMAWTWLRAGRDR